MECYLFCINATGRGLVPLVLFTYKYSLRVYVSIGIYPQKHYQTERGPCVLAAVVSDDGCLINSCEGPDCRWQAVS